MYVCMRLYLNISKWNSHYLLLSISVNGLTHTYIFQTNIHHHNWHCVWLSLSLLLFVAWPHWLTNKLAVVNKNPMFIFLFFVWYEKTKCVQKNRDQSFGRETVCVNKKEILWKREGGREEMWWLGEKFTAYTTDHYSSAWRSRCLWMNMNGRMDGWRIGGCACFWGRLALLLRLLQHFVSSCWAIWLASRQLFAC